MIFTEDNAINYIDDGMRKELWNEIFKNPSFIIKQNRLETIRMEHERMFNE